MIYTCDFCGYIYNPVLGSPESGAEPGTEFDKLPDNWICPDCAVEKDDFSPRD